MLEDCHTSKDQRIHMLEAKVEQGETLLLKVCEALELLSLKAFQCNERPVTSGSGLREEEVSELEYASEDKVFTTPVLDLMTLVLEGNASQDEQCSCFSAMKGETDALLACSQCDHPHDTLASSKGSSSSNLYIEAPVENTEIGRASCRERV